MIEGLELGRRIVVLPLGRLEAEPGVALPRRRLRPSPLRRDPGPVGQDSGRQRAGREPHSIERFPFQKEEERPRAEVGLGLPAGELPQQSAQSARIWVCHV